MAIILPPVNRYAGLQQGLLNFLQARQQAQQTRALTQLGQQMGLNLPPGLSPQAMQALVMATAARQPPFTLAPGQVRFAPTGERIAEVPAKPPTGFKIINRLIDDPASPTKFSVEQFNQAGQFIGRRAATQKEVLQGVPEAAVTKPTISKIERDVIDLQTTMGELGAIEQQFNEDYFTYRGRGAAFFTALAEKAEIPVSRARTEFLRDRARFFADSKRVFLKFRKFITGVAGGIEEFREIAKATIDPEKDSPTQFTAKLNSMRDNALRTSNLLLAIRNSGLEPNKANIKSAVTATPLENIPLQVPPDVNLETLREQALQPVLPQRQILPPQQFTEEEINAELRRRGVIQ